MVIAILVVLGIEAGVILLLLIGLMVFKRSATIRHPGVFKARVRVTEGQFPGVTSAWKKCYSAWVTTVLTTRKGLPLNIADVLPVARLDGVRAAMPEDDLKGLGERPAIASFTMTTGTTLELAVNPEEQAVALKPWSTTEHQASSSNVSPGGPLPLDLSSGSERV